MAFDLQSISNEKRLRAPRILLLGVEKIGKSTFAASSNKPVFIPIAGEEGIDSIQVPQFPTCYSKNDVLNCLQSLCSSEHDYRTVVIDSTSALEPITKKEICDASNTRSLNNACGGFGAGQDALERAWIDIRDALDYLRNTYNISSILIGHVKVESFTDPNSGTYNQWNFAIHDRVRDLLLKWADCILFANCEVIISQDESGEKKAIDIGNGQRYLYTQKRPNHPGGGRGVFGHLPYKLPLSWDAFIQAITEAPK